MGISKKDIGALAIFVALIIVFVLLINSIGMALVALAVACGIGVAVCVGYMGETLTIMPALPWALGCGVATVVFGKLGTMFCEV